MTTPLTTPLRMQFAKALEALNYASDDVRKEVPLLGSYLDDVRLVLSKLGQGNLDEAIKIVRAVYGPSKVYEVFAQPWDEFDRWSGRKAHGVSLHPTEADLQEHCQAHLNRQTGDTPEWYEQPVGSWKLVRVSKKIYDRVHREGVVRNYADGIIKVTYAYEPEDG